MGSYKKLVFCHLETLNDVSLNAVESECPQGNSIIRRSLFGGGRSQSHDRDTWKVFTEITEFAILCSEVMSPFLLPVETVYQGMRK